MLLWFIECVIFECVCVYILRYCISFEVIELEAKSDVVVEQQAIKSKHTVAEKKRHQKYFFVAFKKRYRISNYSNSDNLRGVQKTLQKIIISATKK